MGCFWTIVFLAGFVFVMVSFIRWFEQTAEAVDNGWWNKVTVLLVFPFSVWFYPSRVAAGRATPVPHHEPVRGFGGMPKTPDASEPSAPPAPSGAPAKIQAAADAPPPGTPKEFLGLPKMTTAKPRAAPDPDKIAKLQQKMREQGMLPPEE